LPNLLLSGKGAITDPDWTLLQTSTNPEAMTHAVGLAQGITALAPPNDAQVITVRLVLMGS
jgi:hypothetical protein